MERPGPEHFTIERVAQVAGDLLKFPDIDILIEQQPGTGSAVRGDDAECAQGLGDVKNLAEQFVSNSFNLNSSRLAGALRNFQVGPGAIGLAESREQAVETAGYVRRK